MVLERHANLVLILWMVCLVIIIPFDRFTVGAPGSVMYSFKKKGVLELKDVDGTQPLTLDLAMEIAIEVGAEDVIEEEDEDGKAVFKVRRIITET